MICLARYFYSLLHLLHYQAPSTGKLKEHDINAPTGDGRRQARNIFKMAAATYMFGVFGSGPLDTGFCVMVDGWREWVSLAKPQECSRVTLSIRKIIGQLPPASEWEKISHTYRYSIVVKHSS